MAFRFAAADTQAQGGAAGNSGFFAITRRNHRNFQASLVQAPSRKLLADFFEKGTEHGGCAASDDDDVGLQQIHDVAKPDGEHFDRLEQDFPRQPVARCVRSEEHTSELQSPCNLVCRLLLEKKKKSHLITDLSNVYG